MYKESSVQRSATHFPQKGLYEVQVLAHNDYIIEVERKSIFCKPQPLYKLIGVS